MKTIKKEWITTKSRYVSGETLMLGNIAVANVFYDGITSDRDGNKYKCKILLPGIRFKTENHETIDKAKEFAESAVNLWLNRAGLL